jgi:hypothetical protein
MPRFYKRKDPVIITADKTQGISCNYLEVQNEGTTKCFFDGLPIEIGQGRKFPVEIEGELAVYQGQSIVTFEGGTGKLRIIQIIYSSSK